MKSSYTSSAINSPTSKSIEFLNLRIGKNFLLRVMAMAVTILCSITLSEVGEPRPLKIAVLRGILLSLILTAPLWICSLRFARQKLRYPCSFLVLLSGIGVFIISPFGWTLATALLLFHCWLLYDLLLGRDGG